jgi:bacterioferritin-associated ferredoxin
MKKPTVICRCEEITEQEILDVIKKGYTSLDEIKRILRCGMGHCQGRSCLRIIARILNENTGKPVSKMKFPTSRPPLKPIPIKILAKYQSVNEENR